MLSLINPEHNVDIITVSTNTGGTTSYLVPNIKSHCW